MNPTAVVGERPSMCKCLPLFFVSTDLFLAAAYYEKNASVISRAFRRIDQLPKAAAGLLSRGALFSNRELAAAVILCSNDSDRGVCVP
jgi:hypothetical protein